MCTCVRVGDGAGARVTGGLSAWLASWQGSQLVEYTTTLLHIIIFNIPYCLPANSGATMKPARAGQSAHSTPRMRHHLIGGSLGWAWPGWCSGEQDPLGYTSSPESVYFPTLLFVSVFIFA